MSHITDDQLEYRHHIAFFERLGNLSGDPVRDRYWHQQAEYLHALSVCDGVLDLHLISTMLAQQVNNSEADFQLRFGVSRRAKFIWLSLRNIVSLLNPEREEPLLRDQVDEAARDLNVIYINIRGLLDNYASILVAVFGDEQTRKLSPMQISLFGEKFLKDKNMREVAKFLASFSVWNTELKGRRDPAAHRIPLSVPPAVIDKETRAEFEQANAEYYDAFNKISQNDGSNEDLLRKLNYVGEKFDRLERIGKFAPVFVHHPDEGAIKIYPTVPQDIGQLVKIGRGLERLIFAAAPLSPVVTPGSS